ncbi:MAG: glycosyltransferase family 4 protein [Acidobacteriota bacterium]|nr:glycosyltransferase family 4 protein [Acidobacteriota bacterium]
MRLFVCTPSFYLQGGVERILESLAQHLPSRGIEVTFGLAKGARFHDPQRFREAFPVVRGVDVDARSGTAYARRRALRRAIEKADPDVVLIARIFDAYPAASELKLRGHRLRLAVTIQALETPYFADFGRYQEFVDVCITSGEEIARIVRGISDVPAMSIPGGVAPPHRLRQPHTAALRLGYVGRVEQLQKRVLDLPLVCDELTRRGVPFTCDVAGDGTVLPQLREASPQARFHGWLSTGALYERVYPELDVFLHFAEWEGLTIAPREAMAHGVVPVVSRFAGAEDFAHEVNSLTFPVGDIRAAADCVERLHRDRALLERLSAHARASQEGIRSEQGAIDAWAAAFRDAVARPARIGTTLPAPPRDEGFLTRYRVPDAVAELVRRVRRREHGEPGSEWPHASGLGQEAMEATIARLRSTNFSNEK